MTRTELGDLAGTNRSANLTETRNLLETRGRRCLASMVAVRFLIHILLLATAASWSSLAANSTSVRGGNDNVATFSFSSFNRAFSGVNVTARRGEHQPGCALGHGGLQQRPLLLALQINRPRALLQPVQAPDLRQPAGRKRVASFSTVFTVVVVYHFDGMKPGEGVRRVRHRAERGRSTGRELRRVPGPLQLGHNRRQRHQPDRRR